jgi:hypothetical protein
VPAVVAGATGAALPFLQRCASAGVDVVVTDCEECGSRQGGGQESATKHRASFVTLRIQPKFTGGTGPNDTLRVKGELRPLALRSTLRSEPMQSFHDRCIEAAIEALAPFYHRLRRGPSETSPSLRFELSDSELRLLTFCLTTVHVACVPHMENVDAVLNEMIQLAVAGILTPESPWFIDLDLDPQDVANRTAEYTKEYLHRWSAYVDIVASGRLSRGTGIVASMLRHTETDQLPDAEAARRVMPIAQWVQEEMRRIRETFGQRVAGRQDSGATVITYSNTPLTCYTTVRLVNGDDIFVSIAGGSSPSITVSKSRLLGLRNTRLWTFTAAMAGSIDRYALMTLRAFADLDRPQHPLDAIQALVMRCRSAEEVGAALRAAETRMTIPLPIEDA